MTSINHPVTFHFSMRLDTYQSQVENACRDMRDKRILDRLWNRDHRLWKPEPDEIHNRLGWLQSVETMSGELARLHEFARDVHSEGYTHALLLGMGAPVSRQLCSPIFPSAHLNDP